MSKPRTAWAIIVGDLRGIFRSSTIVAVFSVAMFIGLCCGVAIFMGMWLAISLVGVSEGPPPGLFTRGLGLVGLGFWVVLVLLALDIWRHSIIRRVQREKDLARIEKDRSKASMWRH